MKVKHLHQFQLISTAAVLLVLLSSIVLFQYFVEQPKHIATRVDFQQRELQIVQNAINNRINELKRITNDYAVWDSTYNFVQNPNEHPIYVAENLIDETFINLEIDGVIYINRLNQTVFNRGFDHQTKKPLDFRFSQFDFFPEHKDLLPKVISAKGQSTTVNIITTNHGPAIIAIAQIRQSDQHGDFVGYLAFIKLIKARNIAMLSRDTFTKVEIEDLMPSAEDPVYQTWDQAIADTKLKKYSLITMLNVKNQPLFLLKIHHMYSEPPPILGEVTLMFILILGMLSVAIVMVFYRNTIVPVKDLADIIEKKSKQDELTPITDSFSINELDRIKQNFNALVTNIEQKNELLEQQIYVDVLTDIPNRRAFEEHLARQIELLARNEISFTLIMADIDFFKLYNDTLGHQAGDYALVDAANTLSKPFNRANDICARYGGEEFVMMFSDISEANLKLKLSDIIDSFQALNLPHPASSIAPYLTVSLGACIVTFEDLEDYKITPKSIVLRADQALYLAKKNGRNRFEYVKFSEQN